MRSTGTMDHTDACLEEDPRSLEYMSRSIPSYII